MAAFILLLKDQQHIKIMDHYSLLSSRLRKFW